MKKILCPSMMCADYGNLRQEVSLLEEAGVDIFHCDIMDGAFVENMAMGLEDVKMIRSLTKGMVDVHLMIEHPSKKIQWFIDAGVDLIYIHPESERYTLKTLLHIKNSGLKAGIALNPSTSVATVVELLPYVDYVMVMSVEPGFTGQTYLQSMTRKVKELLELQKEFDYLLIVDGACSKSKISELSKYGVNGFVLGTSALFSKEQSFQTIMKDLRSLT